MAKKGHLTGEKIATTHTTVIEAAKAPARAAENLAEVKKVSLKEIRQCRGGSHQQMKFTAIAGGWLVRIVGSHAVQDINVYLYQPTTDNLVKVQDAMTTAFIK